jgi:uncharacterized membrane protein YraQ (UPF0718 family)
MSLGSVTGRAPDAVPSAAKWIAATVAGLILWGLVYSQLIPFSDWVVAQLPVRPESHLGAAVSFFAYDTPKVLMLLTLVVFAMGVVRSFFSPEKTRALLAGNARASAMCWPPGSASSRLSARVPPSRCSSASSAPVCRLVSRFRS